VNLRGFFGFSLNLQREINIASLILNMSVGIAAQRLNICRLTIENVPSWVVSFDFKDTPEFGVCDESGAIHTNCSHLALDELYVFVGLSNTQLLARRGCSTFYYLLY